MQHVIAPWRHHLKSVRIRLMLWYITAMTLILLMFCGILYSVIIHLAQRNLDDNLQATAQQIAHTYTPNQQQGIEASLLALGKNSIAIISTPQGKRIQSLGPLTPSMWQSIAQEHLMTNTPTDLWLQTSSQGKPAEYRLITLSIATTQQPLILIVGTLHTDQRVGTYLLIGIGISLPLLLLMTASCGYWIATRAMRPIHIMSQTAREIDATDLSRRLHINSQDELGELASTFDHMLSRLEAAFTRQHQFTADVSHELRTPLSIIEIALHRALFQEHVSPEQRSILETIQQENTRMTHLVNDLLQLARADDANHNWKKEPLDISDLVLDSIEHLMPRATQLHIEISIGALPELWIAGEKIMLASMLDNLLENALKYTAGVGSQVRIECSSQDNQWARIRIQDDGPGIAEHHQPYLFERFYRANHASASQGNNIQHKNNVTKELVETSFHTTQKVSGNGLGLSIVQKIVQAHQGKIQISSQNGHGSTFDVWLPLLNESAIASTEPTSAQ